MINIKKINSLLESTITNITATLEESPCDYKKTYSIFMNWAKSNFGQVQLDNISLSNYKILKTYHNKILLLTFDNYCKNNLKISDISNIVYIIGLVNCIIAIHKYIPYCYNNKFLAAVSLTRSNHTIKRTKSLTNAIRHISNIFLNEVSRKLTNCEGIIYQQLIFSYRTRIFNMIRKIANLYMNISKSKETVKNYTAVINSILTNITMYGNIHVPSNCSNYSSNFNKLTSIDYNSVEASVFEVITILKEHPSLQKINRNLNKLKSSKQILNLLKIPVTSTSLYCLVSIYYKSIDIDWSK